MELYRGDFLDGLHVEAAARELQDWLDRERDRLRRRRRSRGALAGGPRRARGARLTRCRLAGRAGTRADPDDESALRRLIALLDRAGDRTGAIQAYDEFTRRMA